MSEESVRILLFHRISPPDNLEEPSISPELFEGILQFLIRNFTVISLEEYFFKERIKFIKEPVIITFDSCHPDFLKYSLPLLKKYDLPSTLFVSANSIDQQLPAWDQLVKYLFNQTNKLSIAAFPLHLHENIKTSWKSADSRIKYGKTMIGILQTMNAEVQQLMIQHLISGFNDVKLPADWVLCWEDLSYLKSQGVEIGVHVVSPDTNTRSQDDKELEKELLMNAFKFKKKLGNTPSTVSFNTERNSNRVKNVIHRTGYRLGLAKGQRLYVKSKFGRYTLPRIEISYGTLLECKIRINGTFSWLTRWI